MVKLFELTILSAVLNIIFTPFNPMVTRVCGIATLVLFWVFSLIEFFKKKEYSKGYGLSFLLFILSTLVGINRCDSIDGQLWNAILSFYAYYLLLSLDCETKINFDFIKRIAYLLGIVFCVYGFSGVIKTVNVVGGTTYSTFNLGLGNPNAVSVYVIFVSMVIIIDIFRDNKRSLFVFLILKLALLFVMGVLIIKLESRIAIACYFLSLISTFFINNKLIKIATIVVPLLQCAIIPVLIFNEKYLTKTMLFNKQIDTGRNLIFSSILEKTSNKVFLLVGDMSRYGFKNSHNGCLSVFATFGIIGVIAFYVLWYVRLFNTQKKLGDNKIDKLSFVLFLLYSLQMVSECSLALGAMPYVLFFLVIFKIANGEVVFDKHEEVPK